MCSGGQYALLSLSYRETGHAVV